MLIEERKVQWPIMVVTNQMKANLFQDWVDDSTYSLCVSIAEFDYQQSLILIIDCDVSMGRLAILKWWTDQE